MYVTFDTDRKAKSANAGGAPYALMYYSAISFDVLVLVGLFRFFSGVLVRVYYISKWGARLV